MNHFALIFQVIFALHFFPLALQGSCGDFQAIRQEAEKRWQSFRENRDFKPFVTGRSEEGLKEEFEVLRTIREEMWTTAGYESASHLIVADLVRAPGCAAFAYNNTVPYYNASTICIGERCYIASEGPRSKDISKFFDLIKTYEVTHLIRLTDSHEGTIKKCHPYWEGLMGELAEGKWYLQVPTETGVHLVRAFDLAHWRDNQGIDPDELLALVLQVREEMGVGLPLVHCSAGVGRTGTFIAALAIVDAIDRGEPFSIEEIVFRLSLQRVHSVGRAGQYVTLHRLAENYQRLK